ncbi:MAG TPA: DUF6658 family protein [Waterburya sp.]|jgi:hypothetical protein
MKKLMAFFKQLRLSQLLTAFLATVVLFVGTACNSGDVRGARPDNPPVQAGGANNPYKAGGDTRTNYNLSPDPKVSSNAAMSQLIAASDKIQYPSGDEITGSPADEQHELPIINQKNFEAPEPGGQIQRESSVGDRIKDRLGTVKETFGEASEFVREDTREGAKAGIKGSEGYAQPNRR